MKTLMGLALPLLLAACANYPRDLEGTSKAIAERHTIRVGTVAGHTQGLARQRAFLAALQAKTGAQPTLVTGSAEPLLLALDRGELDLVIGELSRKTPWLDDVAVIEPIATRMVGDDEIDLSPVARNGENRWVMTLEQTVRDLPPRSPEPSA